MNYELIDSGEGRRLERFGDYILDRPDPEVLWQKSLPESEWQKIIVKIKNSLAVGDSVSDFVSGLNLKRGVTGYSLHVVPVALYAWLRHPDDFRSALATALDCGGDTDTVGAILGALSGAVVGKRGIPIEWLNGIWEWPRSISSAPCFPQRK